MGGDAAPLPSFEVDMASIVRSDMITRVRRRGDFENSEFVSDSELTDFLNRGLCELWDILVTSHENYGLKDDSFDIPGSAPYALPSDFYKLMGVDFTPASGGTTSRVRPFQFQHRNQYSNPVFKASGIDLVEYAIVGDEIKLIPEDLPTGTIKLWYVHTAPQFDLDDMSSEVAGIIPGYEEYPVTYAVMLAKNKEESDIKFEVSNLERLANRITQAATKRDVGESTSIVDVKRGTELYHDLFYIG